MISNLDLNLKNDIAGIKFSSKLEDYLKAGLQGTIDLSGNKLVLNLTA